jgi:hypothetical protein
VSSQLRKAFNGQPRFCPVCLRFPKGLIIDLGELLQQYLKTDLLSKVLLFHFQDEVIGRSKIKEQSKGNKRLDNATAT